MFILNGCNMKSATYEFTNSMEEIISIELLHNRNEGGVGTDEENIDLIYELNEEEFESFMDDIYDLETARCYPPFWGYGDYIAKVTYSNGDVEMLGSLHIEFIPSEGVDLAGYGDYFFKDAEAFIQILEEYCELPDEV